MSTFKRAAQQVMFHSMFFLKVDIGIVEHGGGEDAIGDAGLDIFFLKKVPGEAGRRCNMKCWIEMKIRKKCQPKNQTMHYG